MNVKRIAGVVILIGGLGLVLFANYLKTEIAQGTLKITSAQKSVDRGTGLFSLNPVTKEVGKGVFGGAQQKIAAGQRDIDYYTELANQCQIGGIALMVVGIGMVVLCHKKRRK